MSDTIEIKTPCGRTVDPSLGAAYGAVVLVELERDHATYGACYYCCQTCNLDRHLCPGCGTTTSHDEVACPDCSRKDTT
jgi:predicted amidophosphoribosyltransferase